MIEWWAKPDVRYSFTAKSAGTKTLKSYAECSADVNADAVMDLAMRELVQVLNAGLATLKQLGENVAGWRARMPQARRVRVLVDGT